MMSVELAPVSALELEDTEGEEEEAELLGGGSAPPEHPGAAFADVKAAARAVFTWQTMTAACVATLATAWACVGRKAHSVAHKRFKFHGGAPYDREAVRSFAAKARVVPNPWEQALMQNEMAHSWSTIWGDQEGNVSLSTFAQAHTRFGHTLLPPHFFDCVHIGIPVTDPFPPGGEMVDSDTWSRQATAMETEMWALEARPSAVLSWYAANNQTGWSADGLAVRFCFDDLRKQDQLGVGPRKAPWANAAEQVARVGRRFGQYVVFQWFPHQWSTNFDEQPHRHTSVVQEVVPIRSGLQDIASSGAAYEINARPPKEAVVRIRDGQIIEGEGGDFPPELVSVSGAL